MITTEHMRDTERLSKQKSIQDQMDAQVDVMLPWEPIPLKPHTYDASVFLSNDVFPPNMIPPTQDGVLFGLGFGGSFAMMDYFPNAPQEIVLLDVSAEPVLVGRSSAKLIKGCRTFDEFCCALRYSLEPAMWEEVRSTPNGRVKDLLKSANQEAIIELVERGLEHFIKNTGKPEGYAMWHFARNFKHIRECAANGRLHIGFGDMFQPATNQFIRQVQEQHGGSHVYYVTDAPQFDLENIKNVQEALGDTWFVDTTTPYNHDREDTHITTCRATFGQLPVYDDEYRSYLR